jgi:TRAP-type C4-dicarboxylate transport system permease small subunit
MPSLLIALDRRVGRLVSAAAGILLLCATATGFWQVLTRFLFQAPSDWTEVLIRTMLIWSVYLGIAIAFRRGALVSVDLLRSRIKGAAARNLRRLLTTASVVFLIVVAVMGAQLAWIARFQLLVGLEVSMAWAYSAIPTGCCLAIIGVLAHHVDPAHRELETSL